MAALKPSIKKLATDALVTRLRGDGDLSLPSGMPDFKVDKDRRVNAAPSRTALLSVYMLRQNEPDRIGNMRRPTILNRTLQVEVRVLMQGDDDDMDAFEQWITYCMATAGTLDGLVMSVREAESASALLKDADGKVLTLQSRWSVEYTTLPDDLAYTGRAEGDADASQKDRT